MLEPPLVLSTARGPASPSYEFVQGPQGLAQFKVKELGMHVVFVGLCLTPPLAPPLPITAHNVKGTGDCPAGL